MRALPFCPLKTGRLPGTGFTCSLLRTHPPSKPPEAGQIRTRTQEVSEAGGHTSCTPSSRGGPRCKLLVTVAGKGITAHDHGLRHRGMLFGVSGLLF